MKIFLGQNNYIIGDLQGNTDKIIHDIHLAKEQKADIAIFSELAICGYPPDDFLLFHDFIEGMQKQLERIIKETKDIFVVVGLARFNKEQRGKPLYHFPGSAVNAHYINIQIITSSLLINPKEKCSGGDARPQDKFIQSFKKPDYSRILAPRGVIIGREPVSPETIGRLKPFFSEYRV